MLIENGCAAVKADDWNAVVRGDEDARRRVAKQLNGVDLYFHALRLPENETYTLISIVTLMDMNIIESVQINCFSSLVE